MTEPTPKPVPTQGRDSELLEGITAEVAPLPAKTTALQKHDPYAAFRVPAYRLYCTSFVLAIIGSQTLSAAANFDVYQKTKSSLMVGMIGLANAIPLLALAMPAGHVADTFSRKRVLLFTQVFLVACPLALSFWHTLPAIFALLVVNAVALTFGRPSRASILPNLVPKSIFANAVTWNSSMFELAASISPACTGFIIAGLGVRWAYLVSGIAMAGCMILTFFLPDIRAAGARQPMTWKNFAAGVTFVSGNSLLLGPMLLDLLAVLLSGATALLPAFAERMSDSPKEQALIYGWLMAAPSIGAVMMAIIQAHRPPPKRAGRTMLVAVAFYGVATIIFGLSHYFWLSFFMLAITGVCDNLSVVIRHTLVQLATPDNMRGRVSAVNQIFIISSNELGKVESGVTAHFMGPVKSVVAGGIGTILVVFAIARTFPRLRNLGELHGVKPIEPPEAQREATAVTSV
ncbi:MAG TPA: MFS transporter [Tepidisphaeraceae bacterium]|nr:MFS transporter [Tepidisphaeraceae bacterium]